MYKIAFILPRAYACKASFTLTVYITSYKKKITNTLRRVFPLYDARITLITCKLSADMFHSYVPSKDASKLPAGVFANHSVIVTAAKSISQAN